ncbi:MAG: YidB family protein [Rhodomicrobium sp.]
MGLLDGLIGGAIGAEMVTVVNGFIEKHGGVQGLVEQFQQKGLGPTVQSWVGNGENLPISPEQVHQALGSDTIQQLAAKLGIPPDQLAAKLSEILPQAVDKMTPDGRVS